MLLIGVLGVAVTCVHELVSLFQNHSTSKKNAGCESGADTQEDRKKKKTLGDGPGPPSPVTEEGPMPCQGPWAPRQQASRVLATLHRVHVLSVARSCKYGHAPVMIYRPTDTLRAHTKLKKKAIDKCKDENEDEDEPKDKDNDKDAFSFSCDEHPHDWWHLHDHLMNMLGKSM